MVAYMPMVMFQCVLKNSNLIAFTVQRNISSIKYYIPKHISSFRLYCKDASSLKEEEFDFEGDTERTEEEQERELALEKKRDKSRLQSHHRNIIHGKQPYDEPKAYFHHSKRYKQRMIGRYGLKAAGDAPLGILWPTKEELESMKEYNRVLQPESIQVMLAKVIEDAKAAEKAKLDRDAVVAAKYAKLEQWKEELAAKIEKANQKAEETKLKKERMVEEVRRHFGYMVDPKEEKFKLMLEQKEKEQAKLEKAARKAARQEKMLQKLKQEGQTAGAQSTSPTQPQAVTPPPPSDAAAATSSGQQTQ